MIYTFNHKENYLHLIAQSPTGEIYASAGSYAFRSREDAERGILAIGHVDLDAVFGLEADWEHDVRHLDWWGDLLNPARVIVLDDNDSADRAV